MRIIVALFFLLPMLVHSQTTEYQAFDVGAWNKRVVETYVVDDMLWSITEMSDDTKVSIHTHTLSLSLSMTNGAVWISAACGSDVHSDIVDTRSLSMIIGHLPFKLMKGTRIVVECPSACFVQIKKHKIVK